jgi:hypothetical protein
MRRFLLLCLLTCSCVFLTARPEQDFLAESFLSDIYLQQDGSLRIDETTTYHFTNGQFSYTRRTIPVWEVDHLLFMGAEIDGVAVHQQKGKPNVSLHTRSNMEVIWNFDTVHDTVHAYTLHFKAFAPYRYEIRDLPGLENGIRKLLSGNKAQPDNRSRNIEIIWKPLPADYPLPGPSRRMPGSLRACGCSGPPRTMASCSSCRANRSPD